MAFTRGRPPKDRLAYDGSYIHMAGLAARADVAQAGLGTRLFALRPHVRPTVEVGEPGESPIAAVQRRVALTLNRARDSRDPVTRLHLLGSAFELLLAECGPAAAPLLAQIRNEYVLVLESQRRVYAERELLCGKAARLRLADGDAGIREKTAARILQLQRALVAAEIRHRLLVAAIGHEDSRLVMAVGELYAMHAQSLALEQVSAAAAAAYEARLRSAPSNGGLPEASSADSNLEADSVPDVAAGRAAAAPRMDPKARWDFVVRWFAEHGSLHPLLKQIQQSIQRHETEYRLLLRSRRDEDLMIHTILLESDSPQSEIAQVKAAYTANCTAAQMYDESIAERQLHVAALNQKILALRTVMGDMKQRVALSTSESVSS